MFLDAMGLASGRVGLEPMLLLLVALVLDAAVGGLSARWLPLPHPVRVIGGLADWFDRKLNRPNRPAADRMIRGAVATLFVATVCAAVGWGVSWLTLNHDFGWIVELLLVTSLLSQRSLFVHVRRVAAGLRRGGLADGRDAVAQIVGRDVQQLDEHGVARAAIESCAENFGDGVVGPVFWYLLFGLPGMLVYKGVNTLDSMIGHRTSRHHAFGMTAARLDDVMNLAPARLAALFLVLAAVFVPAAAPSAALRTTLRDARRHRSLNAGWPEGAAAGALGLALAGPRRYQDMVVADSWIGDGRARATPGDIDRMLFLYVVACLINGLVTAAVVVAALGPA